MLRGKRWVYVFGIPLAVVLLAISIVGMLVTPDSQEIPTPGIAIGYQVTGMMAALLALIIGFVRATDVSDDEAPNTTSYDKFH